MNSYRCACVTIFSAICFMQLLSSDCGVLSRTRRVIHGSIAKPHSIPYQAYLEILIIQYNDLETVLCGGSLIKPSVVLTAGHCTNLAIEVTVILGAHQPLREEYGRIQMTSRNIITHGGFSDASTSIQNDIGLIILPKPVELTDHIQLAKLPSIQEADELYLGQMAIISGWGWKHPFLEDISHNLRFTQSHIMRNSHCQKYFDDVTNMKICTSGSGGQSCHGDSGGPLTVNDVQVGIVSYGNAHCIKGYPSVFTRTGSYLPWIEENSKIRNS